MSGRQCSWSEEELRQALDTYESELRAAGMARNSVTTYVQHPERFINWLVGKYRPALHRGSNSSAGQTFPAASTGRGPGRSRYQPLRDHLAARSDAVIRMTFSDIERVIGAALPASARRYRPWWANEQEGTHVHARAWMHAGRRTANVDLNAQTVDFVR